MVLNAWAESSIHYEHLFRPLVAAAAISIIVTLAMMLLAGDRDLGALAAFAVTLAAISSNQLIGLALLLLALFVVPLARLGTIHSGPMISRVAATFGVALLVVNVVMNAAVSGPSIAEDLRRTAGPAGPNGAGPDIYVILLDGYPGSFAAKVLDPGWDRERFPSELAGRGFQVLPESRSNYVRTDLTLASMFAMRHVTPADDDGASALRWMVDGGTAVRLLREHGYATVSVSSGFAPVDIHTADRRVAPVELAELDVSFLRSTNAGKLLSVISPDLVSAQQRGRIEAVFRAVETEAGGAGRPQFVFAHVPAPHGPWVYAGDGASRTDTIRGFYSDAPDVRGISRDEAISRLFDQTTYVGDRALRAIDRILERDPRAVVVVFSDHGPGIDYHGADLSASDLDERTSNIIAVRSPDGVLTLPPGTTPVNLFPLLFNSYLGTQIPTVDDRSYTWAPH